MPCTRPAWTRASTSWSPRWRKPWPIRRWNPASRAERPPSTGHCGPDRAASAAVLRTGLPDHRLPPRIGPDLVRTHLIGQQLGADPVTHARLDVDHQHLVGTRGFAALHAMDPLAVDVRDAVAVDCLAHHQHVPPGGNPIAVLRV